MPKNKPDYLVRPNDLEIFSLNEDGETYSIKAMKDKFPSNLHMEYPFERLSLLGFLPAESKDISSSSISEQWLRDTVCREYERLVDRLSTPTKELKAAIEEYSTARANVLKRKNDLFPHGKLVLYVPTKCICLVGIQVQSDPIDLIPLIFENGNCWFKTIDDIIDYNGPCPDFFTALRISWNERKIMHE